MSAEPLRLLSQGELELEGRLLTASNATFVGTLTLDGTDAACVYKPVRGERPLRDFPTGTLANRERVAYLVSEAAGIGVVPPTVLRDGPFGPGMCQLWIEEDTDQELVDIVPVGEVAAGWCRVLDAEDQHARPVSLVHRDHPALQGMAVLDILMNNADRKGGHVLADAGGHVYGVDHGVCFHAEPKLRTVLWGWAGTPLPGACVDVVVRVRDALDGEVGDAVADLLSKPEVVALRDRAEALLAERVFPLPSHGWPPIPWPAF